MPAERVAVLGVLRLEVLGPVLADDLDPGLGEHRHVLDARRTSSPRRRSRRARPRPAPLVAARTASGDAGNHPLPPGAACRRGGVRRRAPGGRRCTARRARRVARPPRRAPARPRSRDRGCRPRTTSGPKRSRERPGHLVPHLVAARADPRADGGRDVPAAERRRPRRRRSRRAGRASRRGGPRPRARRRLARDRDRQAVGGDRNIGRPGSSVQRPSPGSPREPATARSDERRRAPAGCQDVATPGRRRPPRRGAGGSRRRARGRRR